MNVYHVSSKRYRLVSIFLGELQEKNRNICIRMYNGYVVLFVTADELSDLKLSRLSECAFALCSRGDTNENPIPD